MPHVYKDLPGAGSVLSIEIGSTMTEILGVSEINHDGFKRGMRTPTPLSALAAVKKPGMPDFGQLKCKWFYDPNEATHQDIRDSLLESAAEASANLRSFKLEYPDGFTTPAHVLFDGFVSDLSMASGDAETGTWTADLTIEVVTAEFVAGSPLET